MTLFRAVVFTVAGLAFGSFLTVVIWRAPRKLSLVSPRSRCPGCEKTIRPVDNVPVISYLLLRGRCRACLEPISSVYPAIELATAALFVGADLRYERLLPAATSALLLGVVLAAGAIDARWRIIPNRIVYPALLCFALLIGAGAAGGGGLDALDALVGLGAFGGTLLLVALASPRGMGMGDVKLAALIGLVLGSLGLSYVAVAAAAAVLMGAVGGVGLMILTSRSRKDAIPFGPYLAFGAAVAVFLAPQLSAAYLGLFA
jgi:leader peptidase (prepilin peptidase)/N-methyltransferase